MSRSDIGTVVITGASGGVGRATARAFAARGASVALLARGDYLARTGYGSQQTGQPDDRGGRGNLWAPADRNRDFGAHGEFDKRSTGRSYQQWASQRRGMLATAAVLATGGALVRRWASR